VPHDERGKLNMPEYFDKNGKQITRGMFIRHEEGTYERVYECEDENGTKDLGINASNEAWLERTGRTREIYPLYQFDTKEWEIVE
jgi:hypothetical protein